MVINSIFKYFKNISVKRFSFLLSLSISLAFAIIYGLFIVLGILNNKFVYAFLYFWILLILSYIIIYFSINQFLFRRVKLIYKLISDTKFDDNLKKDPQGDESLLIQNVEKDVERWILKKNAELDQSVHLEKYRKEYIGNVSHELKTPVFNIQGYLQTLLDGGIDDPTVRKSFIEKAYKNSIRLQSIIEDLNIVYKLESGTQILDLQTFDIKNLIEEVFEENASLTAAKNIKLKFKNGAEESIRVEADKEHIQIVLNNLINNSIKYGKVSGYTKVSLYDLDKLVLIEVTDNGIGISEEHIKHVFDRFYRVDKSRSRDQGGSGLGLSIVKHIIESHGQKLHVRSKEGYGTTFGFTLQKAI